MVSLEENVIQFVKEATRKKARNEWMTAQQEDGPPLFDYRFDHVQEVVRLSKEMARTLGADLTVVTLAAWLHDVAKPGLGNGNRHGERGAEIAREFLMAHGVDKVTIEKVCVAIRKHVGLTLKRPLEPLEAQIVWEADKLTKLGVTGFIHYIINSLKLKPGVDLSGFARDLSEFLPLAKRIAESMSTAPGQQMAAKRLKTLEELSKDLEDELKP